MRALHLDRICKNFGGFHVLQDIHIDLKAGKRLAVIGPNGAGKTTLINIISGVLKSTSGKIELFGKDVTRFSPFLRARRGLARTFQILSLFPNLTVFDSLLLSVMPLGSSRLSLLRPIKTHRPISFITLSDVS